MHLHLTGEVAKKEFYAAIKAMGFVRATPESVEATFDVLDGDHSAKLGYLELDKKLRRLGERPVHSVATATGTAMMLESVPLV